MSESTTTIRIFRGKISDLKSDETAGTVKAKLLAEFPDIGVTLNANIDDVFNPLTNHGHWYETVKEFPELPENCVVTFHDEQGTSQLFWYRNMLVGAKVMNELEHEILGEGKTRLSHIRLDSWLFRVVPWDKLEERYKEVVLES